MTQYDPLRKVEAGEERDSSLNLSSWPLKDRRPTLRWLCTCQVEKAGLTVVTCVVYPYGSNQWLFSASLSPTLHPHANTCLFFSFTAKYSAQPGQLLVLLVYFCGQCLFFSSFFSFHFPKNVNNLVDSSIVLKKHNSKQCLFTLFAMYFSSA